MTSITRRALVALTVGSALAVAAALTFGLVCMMHSTSPARANDNEQEITLLSGSNGAGSRGAPCDHDPLVSFTSDSVLDPQQAIIGWGRQDDTCSQTLDNLGGTVSQAVTSTGNNDTWAEFVTTFQLPQGFANPILNLDVRVWDMARVSLNGHELVVVCGIDASPVDFINTADPSLFQAGTNTLALYVINTGAIWWNCHWDRGPQPRLEPEDRLNLEFEGTVSFTAPALPTPTPTPTLTPTPTPTVTSTPTPGVLTNCPQAGKWAISVWDGPDGTDTGQALTTCGAVPVLAAYHLDPQTGGWSSWFRDHPEPPMSKLQTLDNMQGVLTFGAVGQGAAP